jgi:hypothetical protein
VQATSLIWKTKITTRAWVALSTCSHIHTSPIQVFTSATQLCNSFPPQHHPAKLPLSVQYPPQTPQTTTASRYIHSHTSTPAPNSQPSHPHLLKQQPPTNQPTKTTQQPPTPSPPSSPTKSPQPSTPSSQSPPRPHSKLYHREKPRLIHASRDSVTVSWCVFLNSQNTYRPNHLCRQVFERTETVWT